LIPTADATHNLLTLCLGFASRPEKQPIHFPFWNAVMASSGSNAANFLLVNPLLYRWKANPQL
jgi:hypothetical protein